jgi:nucleoid DNA-binding protein
MKKSKKPVKVVKTKKAKQSQELAVIKQTFSKSALMQHIAQSTEVDTKVVKKVMLKLEEVILGSVNKKGVGEFMMPGLFKVTLRKIPARKAGVLVRNPATGEMVKGKAKPASVRVKIRALSKLKKAAL